MDHEPLTRNDLHEGDPIIVFTLRGVYGPPDRIDATIEKVAIKLVTIRWGDGWNQIAKFRIDDQTENRGINAIGEGMWFRTVAQDAVEQRTAAALARIRTGGLIPDRHWDVALSVDQLEAIARICDPTFVPKGTVVLVSSGDCKIQVIKELRGHLNVSSSPDITRRPTLKEAKDIADRANPGRGEVSVLPVAAHEAGPLIDALAQYADRGVKVEIR